MSETYKKVEFIKIDRLKVSPEKPYELARSYELAPYELAQHPCSKLTSALPTINSFQRSCCLNWGAQEDLVRDDRYETNSRLFTQSLICGKNRRLLSG